MQIAIKMRLLSEQVSLEVMLPRVRQTCAEMLRDRGYVLTRVEEENPVIVADGEEGEARVVFHSDSRVGVKALRQLREELDAGSVDLVLLVSSEGPTPFTRKELGDDTRVEFWTFAELAFNITHFDIAPRHSLVSTADELALQQQYHIKSPQQWPKILRTDPMCRYHAFPVGRLIRIDRTFGPTAHVYYRRVV